MTSATRDMRIFEMMRDGMQNDEIQRRTQKSKAVIDAMRKDWNMRRIRL